MVVELLSEFQSSVEEAEGRMTVAREMGHIGPVEMVQHSSTAAATVAGVPLKEVKILSVVVTVQQGLVVVHIVK